MKNFRKPSNKSRSQKSVDGFVPNTDESFSRSNYTNSYHPKRNDDIIRETGFVRRKNTREVNADSKIVFDVDTYTESLESYSGSDNKNSNVKLKSKKFKRLHSRRGKDKHKPKSKLRSFKKAFASFLLLSILGIGGLAVYTYIKTNSIFRGDGNGAAALEENVDPSRLNGEGDGRVNILLVGKGGEGHEAPDLTDTILLASIDPIKKEAAMVSVPRDLYRPNQSNYRINAVYSTAKQARLAQGPDNESNREAAERDGMNALKEAVSEVLGVPVHYYVMVDFKAFEQAVDTVGGITIDVKEPLIDYTVAWELGGNPVIAEKGLQTFDGRRALFYARSRKGTGGSDFARSERQKEVIIALQQKVLSAGTFSNPIKVVELLNTLGENVRTDLNGLGEIRRLYEIGGGISADKFKSISLVEEPNVLIGSSAAVAGQALQAPKAGLTDYSEIHSFIRNRLKDSFLADENARIIILNGTSVPGLASRTESELESYGYNVIKVDNAPTSDYVKNILIDNTNGAKPYTESYLEKRLGLTSRTTSREGLPGTEEADFVIILGTDETTKTTN